MAICKFFLRGTCKFGDRCRNEHTYSERSSSQYESNIKSPIRSGQFKSPLLRNSEATPEVNNTNDNRWNSFVKNPNPFNQGRHKPQHNPYKWENKFAALETSSQTSQQEIIIDVIKSDIKLWPESGMWPYSVYSCTSQELLPDGMNLEGLPDIQMEEMRLIYLMNGLSKYKDVVDKLDFAYNRRKDELFRMTDSTKATILSQITSNHKNAPSESLNISSLYNSKSFSSSKTNDVEIDEATSSTTNAMIQPVVGNYDKHKSNKDTKVEVNSEIYSRLEDLDEKDKSAFLQTHFEIYQIPECLPPIELCK